MSRTHLQRVLNYKNAAQEARPSVLTSEGWSQKVQALLGQISLAWRGFTREKLRAY
ncbi:unnamed protein product [Amoebophrya sp. A25]|nr:unnamed protein product [Amoebophrya sp. A25]